ncbi:MAG: GldG family protein [Lachnospiraceae bacterium]|nr:GldG family protein [Ruminococcus sp.]MCM1275334.1 GldG family protein [Lachnospiraceae bacterium]
MSKEKNAPENGEISEEINGASEQTAESPEESRSEKPKKPKRKFNARSFKHGSLSVVLTVVFIAAVVVVNVIVGLISERFNTTADLTDTGLYTLDETTEKYLAETLDTDITLTVLRTEKDFEEQSSPYKQVNEILKKMEMAGGHITVNYLDLDSNPNYTSQFKGETLAENYIVVECPKTGRHKVLLPYEYFSFNQSYLQTYGRYAVESSNIEQEAVSAMLAVANEEVVRVAFTEGYGEIDSSALQSLLSKNGYEIETVNLTVTDAIDPGIDFVIMYAPTIDPDASQLAKLDKYLDNGGAYGKNVFYFASTTQPETPNIESFLNDWGVSVGYCSIGQSNANYLISSMTLYAHLQQICDTDYTGDVLGSTLYTLGADLRPVYVLDRSSRDREVLMTTYDNAFLFPLDIGEDDAFSIETAESGIFNDVVISSSVHTDGTRSRLCVVGSEQLAGSGFLSYNNANNPEFFLGIFNNISGKEDGVTIKAKTFSNVTFEMNAATANALAVVLCVVVPVLVIVLGIVIWVRRRHR